MEITNYGHFTQYTEGGYILYRNEQGQDWNKMQMGYEEGIPRLVEFEGPGIFVSSILPSWATVDVNQVITHVEFDPSCLVPHNRTVIGMDAPFGIVQPGMIYNGSVILPAPPLPPVPYTLLISDFWQRFENDDEADAFDAAMDVATPSTKRRAFRAAPSLQSDSDLFAWVKTVVAGVTSASRADAIMAQ